MPPFFSIVIPCYNSEAYIVETLRSLKDQTFQDFEVILIDDHSTDTSLMVATRTFDELQLSGKAQVREAGKYPKGVSGCRNNGIDLATGQWICFLDSDDLFRSHKLESTFKYIQGNTGVKALHHAVQEFDDTTGQAMADVVFPQLSGVHSKLPELLDKNNICTSTVTLNRDLLQQINKFEISLNGIEDYYCWLSISKRTPWHYATEIMTQYRVRAESLMGFRPIAHYMAQNISLLKAVRVDPLFSDQEYKRLEQYLMKEVMVYYTNNSLNKFGLFKTYQGLWSLASKGYRSTAFANAFRITKNEVFKKIFR